MQSKRSYQDMENNMVRDLELRLNEHLSDEENEHFPGTAGIRSRQKDDAQDFLMGHRLNDDDLGMFMKGGPGSDDSPTNKNDADDVQW